jgi:hypothetical protein
LPIALTLVALRPAGAEETREVAETLIRRVIDFQLRQQELQREYAYRERTTTRDLDGDGFVRETKSETFLVTPAPGGEYRRLVARDGAPLDAKAEEKEERKFQEYLDEQLRLTEDERVATTRKKLEDRAKRFRERLEEALEVFDFITLQDSEIQGAPVRVFYFVPKVGYEGHSRATKIFARMEGTIWIDAERSQIAKLSLRFREGLKFLGGVFGRVSEGTEAVAEAWRDGDLWLLDRVDVQLDARLYFLKRYRQHIVLDYTDYEKYSVGTEETLGRPGRN